MDADEDDVAAFLVAYADACAQAGVAPLPLDALAAVAQAMLAGAVAVAATVH